ncbi:very short patch repair endonuclease [uncultured Novosphingobium sp.]|uniref:very short patch repair endonuclease n=1 Tax=uncultured Novosphingobium sp. TaxID=292277 RepID=UPI002598ECF6|nr:very short patch repair endonuclease [uncultured Novosphingobium sp.]
MAAIKGSHTKPELAVRKALHAAGLRFRLHAKGLPGKPDLVFPRYKAVLFVNGCFWHQHDCHLFKWPATREDFWREKIGRNIVNDRRAVENLRQDGWRVGIIWECALKGRTRLIPSEAMQLLVSWIKSDSETITIRGH